MCFYYRKEMDVCQIQSGKLGSSLFTISSQFLYIFLTGTILKFAGESRIIPIANDSALHTREEADRA